MYRPDGPRPRLAGDGVCTFLFVGGTIYRKGIDVLLAAFEEAFAGRDDVLLVIKDVGAGTFYSGMNVADELRRRQAAGAPIEVLADDLDDEGLAALYRGCDVLVHPYRGEGFAMPVLEAMACGRPVLVTGGGPTDEFCPAAASWRIPARREPVAPVLLGDLQAASEAWMLEPDRDALVRLLREAAADRDGRRARGAAARAAAEGYGLDAIADQYAERLRAVAARPVRRSQPARSRSRCPTPVARTSWRPRPGSARTASTELLAAWRAAFTEADDVALYLLADPSRDGDAERARASACWTRSTRSAAATAWPTWRCSSTSRSVPTWPGSTLRATRTCRCTRPATGHDGWRARPEPGRGARRGGTPGRLRRDAARLRRSVVLARSRPSAYAPKMVSIWSKGGMSSWR